MFFPSGFHCQDILAKKFFHGEDIQLHSYSYYANQIGKCGRHSTQNVTDRVFAWYLRLRFAERLSQAASTILWSIGSAKFSNDHLWKSTIQDINLWPLQQSFSNQE